MFDNRFSRLNRRETLTMLGAFAMKSAVGAPDSALRFSGLDHLAIAAADTEKSVAFYSRIFGHDVLKDSRSPRRYFKIGNGYIAIAPPAQGQAARRVDHICAGIVGFSQAGAKSYLDERGISSRETNVGRYVTDPDGIQVQLWTENSWKELSNASPERGRRRSFGVSSSWTGPYTAPGLRYGKIRGVLPKRFSASRRSAAPAPVRIWFQIGNGRLGLSPVGAGPGVDHFCVASCELRSRHRWQRCCRIGARRSNRGRIAGSARCSAMSTGFWCR